MKNQKKHYFTSFIDDFWIFSYSNNQKFRLWKIPEIDDRKLLNFETKILGFVNFQNYFVSYSINSLFLIDSSIIIIKSIELEENTQIQTVACTDEMIIVSENNAISMFSENFELINKVDCNGPVIFISISTDLFFLVFDDKIQSLSRTLTILNEIKSQKQEISCIMSYDRLLFVGHSSGLIKVLSDFSLTEIISLNEHLSSITSLSILKERNYMISCSDDHKIKIWNIKNYHCVYSIYSYKCLKIISSNNSSFFYTLSNSVDITIWDANDFTIRTFLKSDSEIKNFMVSLNEENFLINTGKEIILFNNPLWYKKIQAFGDNVKKTQSFKGFVLKIISGKNLKVTNDFNNWIISPYRINLLTLLTYFNKSEVIMEFSDSNSFFPTISGHTPIFIALSRNFIDLIELFFKVFKEKSIKNPFCLYYLEDSLIELNKKSVSCLHKLYKIALGISFEKFNPKFCIESSNFPIILESSSILTDYTQFMPLKNYSVLGKAIIFKQTFIKINITLGSQESIDFIDSLLKCENKFIFNTQLIQIILNEKWKKVRLFILAQAILYALYLIFLALYSTTYFNSAFLIIPFVFSNILLVYEFVQMIPGVIDYISDIWNFIDLTRAILFLVYSIISWQQLIIYNNLLSIIIFLSWCRGITYFRIFTGTRYYIHLLFQVIKDMISFFIIFFYSIVGFGLVFQSILGSNDYFSYLTSAYLLNFGEMNTDQYNKLQWLYFLFVTILNPIVMLNLLISIMGNTFDRVQGESIIADLLELSCIIKEVELLLFWRRKIINKSYIHICELESPKNKDIGIIKQFKDINRSIKEIGIDIKNSNDNLFRKMDSVRSALLQQERDINFIKDSLGKKKR